MLPGYIDREVARLPSLSGLSLFTSRSIGQSGKRFNGTGDVEQFRIGVDVGGQIGFGMAHGGLGGSKGTRTACTGSARPIAPWSAASRSIITYWHRPSALGQNPANTTASTCSVQGSQLSATKVSVMDAPNKCARTSALWALISTGNRMRQGLPFRLNAFANAEPPSIASRSSVAAA